MSSSDSQIKISVQLAKPSLDKEFVTSKGVVVVCCNTPGTGMVLVVQDPCWLKTDTTDFNLIWRKKDGIILVSYGI